MERSRSKSKELRQVIAKVVAADPVIYNEGEGTCGPYFGEQAFLESIRFYPSQASSGRRIRSTASKGEIGGKGVLSAYYPSD